MPRVVLRKYSNPTGDDAEEIAALGKMIDVDGDDQEYFVELEREEMESADLWERVIADLTEIEKRTGGRDKSPTTAIIETCDSWRAWPEVIRSPVIAFSVVRGLSWSSCRCNLRSEKPRSGTELFHRPRSSRR
jgi:hypothetical protein